MKKIFAHVIEENFRKWVFLEHEAAKSLDKVVIIQNHSRCIVTIVKILCFTSVREE